MPREGIPLKKDNIKKGHFKLSVEGIYKGITRAKKEGNSIEGTGGQKRGQTRNCNLPIIVIVIVTIIIIDLLFHQPRLFATPI